MRAVRIVGGRERIDAQKALEAVAANVEEADAELAAAGGTAIVKFLIQEELHALVDKLAEFPDAQWDELKTAAKTGKKADAMPWIKALSTDPWGITSMQALTIISTRQASMGVQLGK